MINTLATVKGAFAIAMIAVTGIGTGVLADAISAETPITAGGALGVGCTVVIGAWYLSARLQKIDSRLKTIERHMNKCKYSTEQVGGED